MPPRGVPASVPSPFKQIKKRLKDKLKKCEAEAKEIKDSLRALDSIPRISEHAMLRFCERIMGVDTKRIARELLPESAIEYFSSSNRPSSVNALIRGIHRDYVLMIQGPHIQSVWAPECTKERHEGLVEFSFTANEAWRRIFRSSANGIAV